MRKSVLSKKSENIINRVIEALSLKPNQKLYNQNVIAEKTKCGTECCIAGWIHLNEAGQKTHDEVINSGNTDIILDYAERVLIYKDGNEADSRDLFDCPYNWVPSCFAEDYEKANTPAKRVKVAIERLEYFKLYGE